MVWYQKVIWVWKFKRREYENTAELSCVEHFSLHFLPLIHVLELKEQNLDRSFQYRAYIDMIVLIGCSSLAMLNALSVSHLC